MRHAIKALVVAFVAAVMMGAPCMAQDVEPHFTWAGKGVASVISEGGTEDITFQFEMSVDEQGIVEGKTSNEDGVSRIQHVFYSERKQYEFPDFFSRKIVIVLLLNEYGNNPMLSVLNGRVLGDRFLYGEVMLARYEEGSETAKALGVGDREATLIEEDELPSRLKTVLQQCLPIGVVKLEGDYKSRPANAAAGGDSEAVTSQADGTMALFNGRDFEGWQMYLKDTDVDPKSVWQIRDGAIWCTGESVGCLRTTKEYSDFRIALEWRWPEKPTNSGVLLRMGGEEKIWPLCMEAQLMHTRAGDFVGMGCDFNENKGKKGDFIRYAPRMHDSNEKAPGGWNTYEIVCQGDTMEVIVNGQIQNRVTGVSLRKGYIGLQSEGSPIMFRNIKLTPLR
jgi:hypothetical protein